MQFQGNIYSDPNIWQDYTEISYWYAKYSATIYWISISKASANVRIASWNQCVFKVGTFARDIRISTERTSSLVRSLTHPNMLNIFGAQGLTEASHVK